MGIKKDIEGESGEHGRIQNSDGEGDNEERSGIAVDSQDDIRTGKSTEGPKDVEDNPEDTMTVIVVRMRVIYLIPIRP